MQKESFGGDIQYPVWDDNVFLCLLRGDDYDHYAKTVGLTYMSLTVLEIVYYAEAPQTQKDICALCHYNKQVVNMIVKGFSNKGYIKFVEVSEDRRNKYVLFTDVGQNYAQTVLEPLWNLEKKALTVLSDEERKMMLEMMERCYQGYSNAKTQHCISARMKGD